MTIRIGMMPEHWSGKAILSGLGIVLLGVAGTAFYLDSANTSAYERYARALTQLEATRVAAMVTHVVDSDIAALRQLGRPIALIADPTTSASIRAIGDQILAGQPTTSTILLSDGQTLLARWRRDGDRIAFETAATRSAAGPARPDAPALSPPPSLPAPGEVKTTLGEDGLLALDLGLETGSSPASAGTAPSANAGAAAASGKPAGRRLALRMLVDTRQAIADMLETKDIARATEAAATVAAAFADPAAGPAAGEAATGGPPSQPGDRTALPPGGKPLALTALADVLVTVDTGAGPKPVYGKAELASDRAEIVALDLPGATWQVRARPINGWETSSPHLVRFRLMLATASLGIAAMLGCFGLLIRERHDNRRRLKAQEETFRKLSERFNLAMESSNIGIWELPLDSDTIYHDENAVQLLAYEPGTDFGWLSSIHPDDRSKAGQHIFQCLETASTSTVEYRVVLPSGELRHIRSVGAGSEPGSPNRVSGLLFDITADIKMQSALRASKDTSDIKNAELELALDELSTREQQLEDLSSRFELALASYDCGVWEYDFETTSTIWDERMHQLHGYPPTKGTVTEDQRMAHVHVDDRQPLMEAARAAILADSRCDFTYRIVLGQGRLRHVRGVGRVHRYRDGRRKFIGVAFDVSADMRMTAQLKQAKAEAEARNIELELTKNRIEYNALHDPLTGLANRRKLDQELDQLTVANATRVLPFFVLHLDLDRFKEINDTLGHAAGDAMLIQAAQVLTQHARSDDLVARIGGDEFVILLKETADPAIARQLASRIIADMNQPVEFQGTACRFGVSVGIAQSQTIGTDARKMLINADLALYEAKRRGRNCYEFFTGQLESNILTSKRMADDLLTALERDELDVWYQPQFCADTMELVGAEALMRWNHPDHGMITSDGFLKVAEGLNLMGRIDQMVLEHALRDKMRWAAMGIKLPRISVNVSLRRLQDSHLLETLQGLSIAPGEIAFELLESVVIDEGEETVIRNIERIKAFGVEIEVDDFGTGHTSIVSLLKLRPKRLKIDRQLVTPILRGPQERALVGSIIDIARSLGIQTVAEGVESRDHAEVLRGLGCNILQGYAFAHPLSYPEFCRFALDREARVASFA